jgi:glycerol-3-phosphate dehydrogenase
MAEDVMDRCFEAGLLTRQAASQTAQHRLVGAPDLGRPVAPGLRISDAPGLHLYGSEAALVMALPGAARELGGGLTEAMVRFAARHEYARTVEDVLARRSRLLFLDAGLALSLTDEVASLLWEETGRDPQAADFRRLAAQYLRVPA